MATPTRIVLIKIKILFTIIIIANIILKFNVVFVSGSHEPNLETLQQTQIVFRHGNRLPVSASKENDAATLTDLGKQEACELGRYIRQKYAPQYLDQEPFISNIYDPLEVTLVTSEVDRCIRSAQCLQYCLYEDYNLNAYWNREYSANYFEPIPFTTINSQYDNMLAMTKVCPKLMEYLGMSMMMFATTFINNNEELVTYYSENCDQDEFGELSDLDKLLKLYATWEEIWYNNTQKLDLQPCAAELFKYPQFLGLDGSFMRVIANNIDNDTSGLPSSILIKKMKLLSGVLIDQLCTSFHSRLNHDNEIRLRLYSGHDITIQSLMAALNVVDPEALHAPPTASALIIEMHQKTVGEPTVEIWYRNDTKGDAILLQNPQLPSECPLSTFEAYMQQFISDSQEFDTDCFT